MIKFKKVDNLKIILLVMNNLFLFVNTLYSCSILEFSLRVPMDGDVNKRVSEVITKQSETIVEPKINISSKVWDRLNYAVSQLEQSIIKINPSAKITEIIVNDCSLVRDVMIDGSDIDEMYIGINGIEDEDILRFLTKEFSNNIEVDGLEIHGSNRMPRIVSNSLFEKKKEMLLAQKKHIMVIYQRGRFLTKEELFRESEFPSNLGVDKYIARIKFLLLAGEMDIEHAKILLNKMRLGDLTEFAYGKFYEELKECISKYADLMLSQPSLKLALQLQGLLSDPIKVYEVSKDKMEEFEDALFELCDKKLVRIYNHKLIVLWKVHNPRWSDAFWEEQIVVKEKDGDVSSGLDIINRVLERLHYKKGVEVYDESESLFELAHTGASIAFFKDKIMALLKSLSIFDNAIAEEIIKKNIGFFENDMLSYLDDMLKNKDLNEIYSQTASVSQYILRLLPFIVYSNTDKADAIANYIYKKSLLEDKPEFIIYSSIEAMAKILPYIKDEVLYKSIIKRIKKFKKSDFEWIQELAEKTLISAEITKQVKTYSKEEVALSLKDSPYLVVYNKGVLRVLKKDGNVNVQLELGSVSGAIVDFLKQTKGGIIICSATTPEERAIAATNRLVNVEGNIYVKFIAHPEDEYEKFNNQFANPFLWLLHHGMVDKMQNNSHGTPEFFIEQIKEAYADYKKVNCRIAKGILELTQVLPNARIFYHDFHVYFVPKALRILSDKSASSHFIHVPWPNEEYLIENVPDNIMIDLLQGMLDNTVVSFHTEEYAYNFMRTCERILSANVGYSSNTILYNGRKTLVQVNPISIDIASVHKSAKQEEALRTTQQLKRKMDGKIIVGMYARIDVTKGIMEGFAAIRTLLQQHPELRKKIVVYCSFEPYRQDVELYKKLREDVEKAVIAINQEFSPEAEWNGIFKSEEEEKRYLEVDWPIIVVDLKPRKTLFVSCLISDVFLVNSVIDGMNLVAKVYAAINKPSFLREIEALLQEIFREKAVKLVPGVIVASKNMGASEEINKGALLVDPHNIQEISDTLYSSINMSSLERIKRAELTAQQVSFNTRIDWSSRLLNGIDKALSNTSDLSETEINPEASLIMEVSMGI